MKNVVATLKKQNLQVTDLPQELQQRVNSLEQLFEKFKDAAQEYDNQEETNKDTERILDEMEDKLATEDEELADDIEDYIIEKNKPQSEPQPEPQPEPKKKESGLGWLIFGGLALVLTLGAVNTFKKR